MEYLLLLLFVPFLFGDLFGHDEEDATPQGTEDADTLRGDADDELLDGKGGDDVIAAAEGDDTVVAGDGFDRVMGEEGNDRIFAGGLDDLIDGGSGNDTVWMGGGEDNYGVLDESWLPDEDQDRSMAGDDFVNGGDMPDSITDTEGSNTLEGGTGADGLHATDGQETDAPDQLFGGWGGDGIGGDDGDTMTGGESRDDFHIYLDESDDQAVVITDFSADHETVQLIVEQSAFPGLTADDLTIEKNPDSGDVTILLAGQKVAELIAPLGEVTTANIVLPGWIQR